MEKEIAEPVTLTLLDAEEGSRIAGFINGADRNGILRLSLPCALPEGAAVRLDAGPRYSAAGRVLYSLLLAGVHYVTIQTETAEQRREPRIKLAEDARLVSMDPQRALLNCGARVVDVSKSGIGLLTPVEVAREILLKITLREAIVFGTVRHCSLLKESGSFKVGVEIEAVIFRHDNADSNRPSSLRVLWEAVSTVGQSFAKHVRAEKSS